MSNRHIKLWLGGLLGLIAMGAIFYFLPPYFSGEKIVSPLWLNWGGWQLHWYGLFLALGVVGGWWWLVRTTKTLAWHQDVVTLVTITALGGIAGARLLFVLLKLSEFSGQWLKIFDISAGGLSIHGALLGGGLALWWWCRRHKLPLGEIIDQMIPAVVFGQMIGRWGNFFNQEAFGGPTGLPWKMYVDLAHRPMGWENYSFFHPTFLYEFIGLAVLLLVVLLVRYHRTKIGTLFLVYLMGYSLLRFGIEFYRIDSDHWGYLTVAQWGSIGIMVAATIGLILKYKNDHSFNHN